MRIRTRIIMKIRKRGRVKRGRKRNKKITKKRKKKSVIGYL
jgi:hypothetical protein